MYNKNNDSIVYSLIRRFLPVILVAMIILTGSNSSVSALDKEWKRVVVDNRDIQRYRGVVGIWLIRGKESLKSIASRHGTTIEHIKKINDGNISSRSYIFVPYSRETYTELLHNGKGRRIFDVDPTKFIWPVENVGYTSRFGRRPMGMHEGLDISCGVGTVVLAAEAGVVEKSRWYGAMGKAILISQKNGMKVWYGHNSTLLVKEGDVVEQGQIISLSGNTGHSTGPHLHFEIRYMNVALNPEDFLPYGYARPNLVMREGYAGSEPVVAQKSGKESAAVIQFSEVDRVRFLE